MTLIYVWYSTNVSGCYILSVIFSLFYLQVKWQYNFLPFIVNFNGTALDGYSLSIKKKLHLIGLRQEKTCCNMSISYVYMCTRYVICTYIWNRLKISLLLLRLLSKMSRRLIQKNERVKIFHVCCYVNVCSLFNIQLLWARVSL